MFLVGDQVRCTAAFVDQSNAPIDPTTVTFKSKNPSGTISTLVYGTDAAVVRDSLGNYHCDLTLGAHGRWFYRWEGTSATGAAAEEKPLDVRVSQFTNA